MQETPQAEHPWAYGHADVTGLLATDPKQGLTVAEAKSRHARHGPNIFNEEKRVTAAAIFFRQFRSPLIFVLGIAAVLTVVLAEWFDAGIILFAILTNAALGFMQEYKAERSIKHLRSYISERARVVRDGTEQEIDASLVVPGDVLYLMSGIRVVADARLISATNFSTDEALLTGESLPVGKQVDMLPGDTPLAERTNMVFAGTLAVDGFAYALVTATGYQTEIGKLARLVTETASEKTPLQVAVGKLAWVIVATISLLVAIVFALGVSQGQPLYEMFLLSIAIIVGAVPEALPIGLTSVLAVGVEHIARQKGIMRSLTAAETLGSTTVIMTDKTGTITAARMELVDITTMKKLTQDDFDPQAARSRYTPAEKAILSLAALGSDVVIRNAEDDPAAWDMSGTALERNLVRAAGIHGIYRKGRDNGVYIRLPFNSRDKFSVSKIPPSYLPARHRKDKDPHVVIGAPDILLARSSMEKKAYLAALDAVTRSSESGRRVLGVALFSGEGNARISTGDVRELTFLGTISFHDPIHPEVPEALRRIESFGVRVVMVTGDLPGTATAVARAIGWTLEENAVLTGQQLRSLNDAELARVLPHTRIIARVTPEDKLRVARAYQELGEVVAMTGDGVNDAPALKVANIGIAVGSGSDVARSVADLVLLDDNFKTIVTTIEEGKRMLANIKKIFVYLMSNSLDEIILIGGSMLAGIAMPLSAIQIIWVNLFTGSIPAIAFAFERQPLARTNKKFFDSTVLLLATGVGTLSSVLLFILYAALLAYGVPLPVAQSVLFACFASYILVIAFSFRNLHRPIYTYSFFSNKPLLFGSMLGLALLLATLYVPMFQSLFGTVPLSPSWLLFVAGWSLFNVVLVECAKYVLEMRGH